MCAVDLALLNLLMFLRLTEFNLPTSNSCTSNHPRLWRRLRLRWRWQRLYRTHRAFVAVHSVALDRLKVASACIELVHKQSSHIVALFVRVLAMLTTLQDT